MKIVYLGTMFRASGNPTTIHTLTPLLRLIIPVKTASPIRNKLMRLLDMMRTVISARRTDVVMIDTYSTLAFYYAWICSKICKIKKVKYIAYLHGGNLPERIDKNSEKLNSFFTDADTIIAPSFFLKEALEKRGFGPVVYIPNTIVISNYPFKVRAQLQPKLLWVRAFHNIYNPQMAIRVLAALRQTYKNAELCMVGPDKDGCMEECITLAESLKVLEYIKFTGRLTKEEWSALSAEYDIFINTTNFDNTPVSVIEAMALGLPVVCTNVGGIPYLLHHNQTARLVGKDDCQAMVDEVCFLMQHTEQAQFQIKNARSLVESFSWEQVRLKWIDIIQHFNVQ